MTTKEIRNYIHNDLGIDKQSVQSIVRDGIKEEVAKYIEQELTDKNKWSAFIESELRRIILDSADDSRFSYLHCTVDKLYHKIDKEIHDEVLKRLSISLNSSDEEVPSEGTITTEELFDIISTVFNLTKQGRTLAEILEIFRLQDFHINNLEDVI